MSFKVERGLFLLDFLDHHAILGVPLEADIKDIRKRYLKIARRLHPDSCASDGEEDKQRASQFLSKLVNPAWEKLSQEKDRTEYTLLLKLQGQKALRQQPPVELHGSMAKQLSSSGNPDHFYINALKDLAEKQYDHLDQTLELTAQISELNLAYLMSKERAGEPTKASPRPAPIATATSTTPRSTGSVPAKPADPPQRISPADMYYRRAEDYFKRGNYAQTTLELREGLQADPKHSRCHSLLGMVYLQQKQATMAKIHFNKALELDPQNATALEGKQILEQTQSNAGKSANNATNAKNAPPKAAKGGKPDDKAGGGGLFGLFGGKKK